ncbi:MAG TPA: radical SAM protein [Bacteroidales bacterium]|nr:radical SAM protein [Bacteroidales bacterium]
MRLYPYINAIYSLSKYGITILSKEPGKTTMPFSISIELTNLCNLHCPCCATGANILKRPHGFMDLPTAEMIAASLGKYSLSANLYFQGEPMLHPDFFEIAERLRSFHGVISTNGHFLSEENCRRLAVSGLRKIIVSYDGVTPEVYSAYRKGGDLSIVTEGIKCLSEQIKKKKNAPRLELLFLYGRHNSHELREAGEFAASVNASFKIKSMQIPDFSDIEKWIPEENRLSRYVQEGNNYSQKRTPARGCLRVWTTAVITWDGNIVPCCYDKDASHVFGNIHEKPFDEIWNGETRRTFLSTVIRKRDSNDICKSCPQGLKLFF